MGVFNKGKKNSKYSYLDEKLRRLDEDLKKTGLVSDANKTNNIAEAPKITLPKNPSKGDIKLVTEYLETHNKSNWRRDYKLENDDTNSVEEEITRLRLQRKPQKKVDCSSCVTENDLKGKKIIKEEVTFEDKVNKILQIYNEGLLNIPPSENTPDPLTPTDGKFVTFSQLNDHYNLFINRIQQQLSTLGGGGEVRLQYLDDIVGIATNASAYDGKYLKYNDTLRKFEFSDVITGLTTETQTLNNVLNLGNTSALGMSVGVITATSFIGDGSSLSGVITSLVGYSTEGYVDAAVAGVSTFSGSYNDLTDKPTIPSDTGDLTNNVGFVTSGIVNGYSTISYVDNAVAGIVSAAPGALDTLNELAAALGDDANFATTITNSLATKANLSGANFSGVVTATSFDGNASTATYATTAGVSTYATTSGIATNAQGLTGTPNLNVGVVTATYFYGDGSNLTGIAVTDNVRADTLVVSGVSTFQSHAQFGDGDEIRLGNSNDLRIYHNIFNTIDSSAASLYIKSGTTNITDTGNNVLARFVDSGPGVAELYYRPIAAGSSKKLETTNNGVSVSGIVTAISGIVTYYGDGQYLTGIGAGSQTLDQTLQLGNTSSLGMSVGVITATSFNGSATKIDIGSGGGTTMYPLFAANYGASANNSVYNDADLSYNQTSNTLILQNISASGVVTATDFNSSSDIALKENVEVIDNPLDKLLELRGVTFDWKASKKSGVGVVAQDVERVLPQAVGGSEDQKTVNYNAIIGLLVESVKQQQKEIEDLRKRLS